MLKPGTWIEEYADYLYHYAIVRLNDHDLANDLIQETFFSGLRSTKNFKGFATERTWLVSILKRKIIDYYREVNSEKGRSEVRISLYEDTEQESPLLEKHALQNYENEVEKRIESAELLRQIDDKSFTPKTCQGISHESHSRVRDRTDLQGIRNYPYPLKSHDSQSKSTTKEMPRKELV